MKYSKRERNEREIIYHITWEDTNKLDQRMAYEFNKKDKTRVFYVHF